MTGAKPTTSAKRSIVLLARPEILETARMELADSAILLVKAVSTVKEVLTSIPTARPHCLVLQNNMAMPQHILAAKQLADLSASRKVPVVIFGGPLDAALDEKKANIGITDVVDGDYKLGPVLEAIKKFDAVLGIFGEEVTEMLDADIEVLIEERQDARRNRNFARSDEIRDELAAKGIILEDTKDGVRWKRK